MKVESEYSEIPVNMYGISLRSWNVRIGRMFVHERIYLNGKWTPFTRMYKK